MKRHLRYINIAIDEALKSEMEMSHGSVIAKKGKFVSKGFNSRRTYIKGEVFPSSHAERSAMCSLHPTKMKQRVLWGYNLYY